MYLGKTTYVMFEGYAWEKKTTHHQKRGKIRDLKI